MPNVEVSDQTDQRTKYTKFLQELLNEFAKTSEKLYKRWDEYAFIYKERQLNALLFPALLNMNCHVFPEFPFKKKNHDQRFLDYYIEQGKNIYLVELKHAWQSYHSGITTNSKADNEWLVAIEQIQDMTKRVTKGQLVDDFEGYEVYRVALMVMPVYSKSYNIEQDSFQYANALHKEFNRFTAQKNKPNFIGVWSIAKYEDKGHKYENYIEYFPYLAFVAKVEKIFE